MNKYATMFLAVGLLAATPVWSAAAVEMDNSPFHQERLVTPYVVVRGDTLWGISARFLQDPWLWPEVWRNNRHIANPHLIYPGDEVHLGVDGQGRPSFTIQRGGRDVVLAPEIVSGPPQVNEEGLSDTQKEYLNLFLKRNSLISSTAMAGMGHIVAPTREHLILSQGESVLLSVNDKVLAGETLAIYRNGKPLLHPKNGELMGVLVEHVGMVRVERLTPQGPVARIIETFGEVQSQDRVAWPMSINNDFQVHFPAVEPEIKGNILQIQNDLEEAGSHQVVTVGLGRQDRVAQGAVMTVLRAGRKVNDPALKGPMDIYPPEINMPEEKIGSAVIFFSGERASFALLMRTMEPVHKGDILANR